MGQSRHISEESDDDVLSVGTVRPLAPAAPLGGAGLMKDCQLHVDSKDDVLSMGAWAPMDGPGMCCAWLDDIGWVVGWDIRVLPDVFPVLFEETAAVPMPIR